VEVKVYTVKKIVRRKTDLNALLIRRRNKVKTNFKKNIMKTPNFKHQIGKHPIPHAKGIAENEKRDKTKENNSNPKASSEEE
tara:strand:- start:161 stop:406 length:246 start_codon:yes stop_codon:yes gene_type:complete